MALDAAIAQLLTTASELPPVQVRPTTEMIRVTDGVIRILFSQISAPREYCDEGNVGIVTARYQLDFFAPQLSVARALANKVRIALDGFSGNKSDTSIIRISFPSDRFGQGSQPQGANNITTRFIQDLLVVYREQTGV